MTPPVRIAGFGVDAVGRPLTWTVSEGRRGRRWREAAGGQAGAWHSLLLETGPDRRFNHLEIASPAGLWTFHPEADGSLHGNAVGPTMAGVRHIEGWPFGPTAVFIVEGSTIGPAAIAWQLTDVVSVGATLTVPGVVWRRSSGTLERVGAILIERRSEAIWRIDDGEPFEIDPDGLPVLRGGQIDALERI